MGRVKNRVFYKIMHNKKLNNREQIVLKKIKNICKKIDIIVIRVTKNGLGNSKPCNNCLCIMQIMNFKNIHYSNDDGVIVSEKVHKLQTNHKSYLIRTLGKK